MLDKNKGGHFSISPSKGSNPMTKQHYLPCSSILQTRWIQEDGVANLIDFFPRPNVDHQPLKLGRDVNSPGSKELKNWLVRRIECIRGKATLDVEVFPAFNYAQDWHTVEVTQSRQGLPTVFFRSQDRALRLDVTIDCGDEPADSCPTVRYEKESRDGLLGDGVTTIVQLREGQGVSFVLRDCASDKEAVHLTQHIVDQAHSDTNNFWHKWIAKCQYKDRFLDVVARSLMILKLLTFEPTGAIIAAPTFSLPEDFGGTRNWDYRYCWVRDSSFTIYILLRMGFTDEAEAYMNFISDRFRYSRTPEGGLPIMFTIRGETRIDEIELSHLEGYRGSKPVRIGNGAAFHKQLDIYGELLDCIYLYNKYGKPVSYDQWIAVRDLMTFVSRIWREDDMSIWEVRGKKQNFVYSKIMLWVAFDRALRLADRRCFPCPQRLEWLAIRDEICEEVMEKGYNDEMGCFVQSYESRDVLDSAVLIAPLVFFIAPNDPRFLRTVDRILRPPEKGGLTSTGLVYRYDTDKADDGVGGREGTFSMCTFWLVEALTRVSDHIT